jgi:aspartyl/asparaginyl-tRNA synthetase
MKNLEYFLLFSSILGILILLILSNIIEPLRIKIKDIDSSLVFKKVKIEGRVEKVKDYKKFLVIEINDSKVISVLVQKNIKVKQFEELIIIGKVSEYKNEFELVAEKIYRS